MRNRTLTYSAVGALALGMAGMGNAQADGISFEAGDWTLGFDGNVNTFYVNSDFDNNDGENVAGSITGGADGDRGGIRTGLLPAKLGFSATTEQNGWDVGAYISYWPGTDAPGGAFTEDDATASGALSLGTANFRQVYFTVGNDDVGTFKAGRDIGIFGSQVILNDMTLLGVGASNGGASGNTSLGRIGTGYIYADWKGQLTYQTPDMNGFQVTAGLMDPFIPNGQEQIEDDTPAFEAQLTYDFEQGGIAGRAWTSFLTQDVETEDIDETARAIDVGISLEMGAIGLVAYYYDAEGVGTTAQFVNAFDAEGNERDSDGFLVQGTYTLPGVGTKLGLSYGESNLDRGSADASDTDLVEINEAVTFGAYHPLTPSVTLTAEYTKAMAEAHNGNENEEDTIALGGIMFF